jgi:hypothetical protein
MCTLQTTNTTRSTKYLNRLQSKALNKIRGSIVPILGCLLLLSVLLSYVQLSKRPGGKQKPKLAFAFLTKGDHAQPGIWHAFFSGVPSELYRIYSHPKFPENVTTDFLRDNIIPEHVDTRWADVSLVRATLLLVKHAMNDAAVSHVILISEKCIPIKPFRSIYMSLTSSNKSVFMYQTKAEMPSKFLHRHRIDMHVPIEKWVHHAQWMVLSRGHAGALLHYDLTPAFEKVYTADEHYFLTALNVLGIPLSSEVRNGCVTFTNWHDTL